MENDEKPKNWRPNVSYNWVYNGRLRSSSWLNLTGKNFYSINGRRARQDRAGRMRFNGNRKLIVRRRSFRQRP
jgi:hypothetical protein